MVDIGCGAQFRFAHLWRCIAWRKVLREYWCSGSGRFLIWLAKNSSQRQNYLGLEIRQKVLLVLRFQLVGFWNGWCLVEFYSLVMFCLLCLCSWWNERNFGWMNWGLGMCKFPYLWIKYCLSYQCNKLFSFHSYFMFANATVSFEQIISSYPGPLSLVSILVSVAECSITLFSYVWELSDSYAGSVLRYFPRLWKWDLKYQSAGFVVSWSTL